MSILPSLCSTKQLFKVLPQVRVLDGSWHLPILKRNAYKEFLDVRLPGARFFDIDKISDTATKLPHMLPSPEVFSKHMSSMGVRNQDHVVVYDTIGVLSACRVYWTFKIFGHRNVSILNGGLVHWKKEGLPTEGGALKSPEQSDYKVERFNKDLLASFEDIMDQVNRKPNDLLKQVIDARPSGRFNGQEPEPRVGIQSGHIPNSLNIPASSFMNEDKTFLTSPSLVKLFQQHNVDLNAPIITTCGSGVTASTLFFALEQVGAKKVSVYDGSWAEYASRNNLTTTK